MENESMIRKNERRWVIYFALLVMTITTVPYLVAYSRAGADWKFTGFVFGVDDGNSYIAKMLNGQGGAWLFQTPYTTFPQNGVLTFLPYLLLGKLASSPELHDQLVALFHIFRFLAGVALILATYDFVSLFINDSRRRRFTLCIVILGGSLGWLLILLGQKNLLGSMPLDFYSPEAFGFLELYGLPHLALARSLLLWGLVEYLSSTDEINSEKRKSIKAGLLWFFATLVQPLTIATGGVIIIVHLGITAIWQYLQTPSHHGRDWVSWFRYLRRAMIMAAFSFPMIAYTYITSIADPFVKAWTSQNIILSPNPLHYLLAYGLLIPPAILGIREIIARGSWRGFLILGWVLVFPLLAYLPYNLQRRLPEGVWVAFVILALLGLEKIKLGRIHLDRALFVLFPSTVVLILGGITSSLQPHEPLFQPVARIAAFDFLSTHASSGQVVLTSESTGNALPAWAPLRVLIGHGPESINQDTINQIVTSFYNPATTDILRAEILKEFKIQYVFWGPNERELGTWDPRQTNYLIQVFQQGDYLLFIPNWAMVSR